MIPGPYGKKGRGPSLSPQEEQELSGSILDTLTTPLQYLGETIDKPMRAVRGTLNGLIDLAQGDDPNFGGGLLNLIPFSDYFGITDPETSVYGRDMLENVGLAGDNVEGFGGHDWGNIDWGDALADAAGFGIDMINVPVVSGTKAVTTGGKLLKASGGLDKAVARASTMLGKSGLKSVKSGTIGDALKLAEEIDPNAVANFEQVLAKQGKNLADVAGMRVGYGRGIRNPFAAEGITSLDPLLDAAKSFIPQKIRSKAADWAEGAAQSPVANMARQMFSNVKEYSDPALQRGIAPEQIIREQLANQTAAQWKNALAVDLGGTPRSRDLLAKLGNGDVTTGMYRLFELGDDELRAITPDVDELLPVRDRYRDYNNTLRQTAEENFLKGGYLDDEAVDYAARDVPLEHPYEPGMNKVLTGRNVAQNLRSDYLKNIPGGTGSLRSLAMQSVDDTAPDAIKANASTLLEPMAAKWQATLEDTLKQADEVRSKHWDASHAHLPQHEQALLKINAEIRSLNGKRWAITKAGGDTSQLDQQIAGMQQVRDAVRAQNPPVLRDLNQQIRDIREARALEEADLKQQFGQEDLALRIQKIQAGNDPVALKTVNDAADDLESRMAAAADELEKRYSAATADVQQKIYQAKIEDSAQYFAKNQKNPGDLVKQRRADQFVTQLSDQIDPVTGEQLPFSTLDDFNQRVGDIQADNAVRAESQAVLDEALEKRLNELSDAETKARTRLKEIELQPAQIAQFILAQSPEVRAAGIYTDPLQAFGKRAQQTLTGAARYKMLREVLDNPTYNQIGATAKGARQVDIRHLLNELGGYKTEDVVQDMRAGRAADELAAEAGLDPDAALAAIADDPELNAAVMGPNKITVSNQLMADLLASHNKLKGPAPVGPILGLIDKFNAQFQGLNTNVSPAFSMRNKASGTITEGLRGSPGDIGGVSLLQALGNIVPGLQDAPTRIVGKLSKNQPLAPDDIAAALEIPLVQQSLRRTLGLADDAPLPTAVEQYVPNALREAIASTGMTMGKGNAYDAISQGLESVVDATTGAPTAESLFDVGLIGGTSGDEAFSWGKYGKQFVPRSADDLKPWRVRGAGTESLGLGGDVRQASDFVLSRAGETLDQAVEWENRGAPTLRKLMAGMAPDEIRRDLARTQVDYSPTNFSNFENEIMRRLVPFYRFQKSNLSNLLTELSENPGGRVGNFYRGTDAVGRISGSDEAPLPPHARESIGLPLGVGDDGSIRALTGLGLAEEALPEWLSPSSTYPLPVNTETLYKGAGSLHPLITLMAELATGKSLWQRGVDGPREIEDLDPTIMRLLKNVTDIPANLGVTSGPLVQERMVKDPGMQSLETIVMHSPYARLLRSARVATDPRKLPTWMGGYDESPVPWAGPVNLLTGLRVSDVNQNSQDKALRDLIQNAYIERFGARTIERPYLPKWVQEDLNPADQAAADQFEALMNAIDRRRKERYESAR